MKSIAYLPASNQSANASLMTVTNIRSAGASTILVNTVATAPVKFAGTMGTPHTFTDPVTGETITIISEASAVDFFGSISGASVVIDQIAAGYTDLGSKVGDIIVIKPITEGQNNLYNILNQSHNDDGTIKDSAITYNPNVFDHIASGAVLAGLGYGSTLTASLSAGVAYINGIRQVIAAVASRAYTASKDTYVDALYNASGTATIVYTEVSNNAVSPALAANSIRLGIVITGASNIANVGSINQGQEDKLLPITSSNPYAVTDSLGNLICPRDPSRKLLGLRTVSASQASIGTSQVDLTGLAVPFIAPGDRKVKVSLTPAQWLGSGANVRANVSIMEAAAYIKTSYADAYGGSQGSAAPIERVLTPSAGAHTYKGAASTTTGTMLMYADSATGAYVQIKVELE